MFNSISNNFGAGVIQFKDYQTENYIVLNAKFTYNTTSPEYQAADVLEIKVPDLMLSRSADTAVMTRFIDRRQYSSYTMNYDGGTVIRSWIKDKNTICLEKFAPLERAEEITVYIQAMYVGKHKKTNAEMLRKTYVQFVQPTKYLYTNDVVCVIDEHWVFLTALITSVSYAYRDLPWEATIEGLPTDFALDIPFPGGYNQGNDDMDGMAEARIENGVFTNEERVSGWGSTGHDAFIFLFAVRDGE